MTKNYFFFFVFLYPFFLFSQNCSNCNLTITAADTAAYTINTGQTLCITETGVAKGKIIISGGTICNKGSINPAALTCTAGTIINYGTLMLSNSLSINTPGFTLNNAAGATVNVIGQLTISKAESVFINSGTVNITGNINLSAGTINNSGTMNYANLNKTGGTNTNTGTVNCCARNNN
ncbi:MAG: hypothetical protein IT235_00230 [Bacteroidia bacterium]|nr:hypothetical protein [Bacteroidia bacterium]